MSALPPSLQAWNPPKFPKLTLHACNCADFFVRQQHQQPDYPEVPTESVGPSDGLQLDL